MSTLHDKKAIQIMDSIRDVLRYDWNPIGIPSLPHDEYDSYIAPIYRILVGSRSEQELIECLDSILNAIGMPVGSGNQLNSVAQKFLQVNVHI